MNPPASAEDTARRVRESGVVAPADLDATLAGLSGGADLLAALRAADLITPFQAERLAAGKYKGFLLGRYVILDKIGAGGMGQVYLAEHAEMRRLAALKVLPAHLFDHPAGRERFLREARTTAQLRHPNIVKVYDLDREGKLWFLAMEYVRGRDLAAVVRAGGPLSVATACAYALQVARGLDHAHGLGLVHRDIKPSNLLLDAAGVVRVLDLGLVRDEADTDSRLTAQYGGASLLGTADYLAPEQALDASSVDGRADLYSLGATLYYLLSGRPVFEGGRAAQKLVWHQSRDPEPLDSLAPNVPAELARVVAKALSKRREDRHQTPAEFAEALYAFAGAPEPLPADLAPAVPRRRWMDAERAADTPARLGRSETRPVLSVPDLPTEESTGLSEPLRGDPEASAAAPRRLERLVLIIALSQVVLAALVAWVALRR